MHSNILREGKLFEATYNKPSIFKLHAQINCSVRIQIFPQHAAQASFSAVYSPLNNL